MTTRNSNQEFEALVEEILRSRWEFYPNAASGLGLHEYDGRLPDISTDALSRRSAQLKGQIESLERVNASELRGQSCFDHRTLDSALRKELFELAELNVYTTNPMEVMWHIDVSNYVHRNYAPLEQRAAVLTSALESIPAFLESLTSHIQQLGAPVLQSAIEAYEGMGSFYINDIPNAIESLHDSAVKRNCINACHTASSAVNAFVEYLKSLEGSASSEFAIGENLFTSLLKHGEMVDMPLGRLLEVGMNDLKRNSARLEEAASRIDASRTPAEVMSEIAKSHPTTESLVPETRDMLEEIRRYLIDHDIVSVPSEVRCQTVETPSFMRWATAAMDLPGAFETKAAEAYYYVTPVEEHWSDEQREQWLSSFNYPTLRNVSVHEAYPGHYVHYLHTRSAPSKISQIFGAYSFWEGWAHYTEEMMIEEGYGDHDARLILGQLSDALLRDCRYICAIRMHTQGMTVSEATQFFIENAFMEELPAYKEAMRGTFDPMYLNYTLGKLMIQKLHDDYRKEQSGSYSLKQFHDTFLSFGAPPIPLVREMMLANPSSDVL